MLRSRPTRASAESNERTRPQRPATRTRSRTGSRRAGRARIARVPSVGASTGDPGSASATSVSYERMVDTTRTPGRVQVSTRTALAFVFALAITILLLEIAHDAERVIAWVFAAMAVAALVYPLIAWLAHFRFVPRPVAVLRDRGHLAGKRGLRRLPHRARRLERDVGPAGGGTAARGGAGEALRVLSRDQARIARAQARRCHSATARGRRRDEGVEVGGDAKHRVRRGHDPDDLLRSLRRRVVRGRVWD